MRRVYSVIHDEAEDEHIQYVVELYLDPRQRDSLMAFFLSGATLEQAEKGLGVDIDVLTMFKALYADMSVFRNKMEWRYYAEEYATTMCYDTAGEEQVKGGVLYGPTFLMMFWASGSEDVPISEREIITTQMKMAYIKAFAAKNVSITTAEAKEAYKWGQFAVSSAKQRNTIKDTGDLETGAKVAIKQRKATMKADEAGLNLSDILH